MLNSISVTCLLLAALARRAWAEVPAYGQCGGVGYSGDTQCASGSGCVKLNDYYSQCQPGAGVPTTSTVVTTTPTPTTSTPTTTAPTATVPAGPITVLPLGDSITFGMGASDGNSYRKYLKDRLAQDGITIDYIGTVKAGTMTDNDCEGHSGATIDQISGYATSPLAQKPRVVTLMAGTNDVSNGNMDAATNRLITLVDKIFTASPDATVLVASLIPLSFSQANVDSYNSKAQVLVQNRASAGKHVLWASMTAVTSQDLADGVHPNANGYSKMGTAWYNAWVNATSRGWIV